MTRTERAKYWSRKELTDRGWSPAMIRDFLGEPDAHAPGHYGTTQCLYLRNHTTTKELTPEWASARQKAQARSRAARAGIVAHRAKAGAAARANLRIALPDLSLDELLARAAESANLLAAVRGRAGYYTFAPWSEPDPTRDRICVNYIRHERSTYDAVLDASGELGRGEARAEMRQALADAIADRWPPLAEEADRQA